MTISYPFPPVLDDSNVLVSGATVVVASVTDKAGSAIASHGATVNLAGSNITVDYDAQTKGEAWITLTVSKVGSTFTNFNSAPAVFCSQDSSRLLTALPNAALNNFDYTANSVIVGTINATPKNAIRDAIWQAPTTDQLTVGSMGKRLADFVSNLIYGAPPTVAEIKTGLEANGSQLQTIYSKLPADSIAGAAAVNAIKGSRTVVISALEQVERPDAGSSAVLIEVWTRQPDADGNMLPSDADAAPTITAFLAVGGTSRDDHLSSTTMTRVAEGQYAVTYTVQSTDSLEQVKLNVFVVRDAIEAPFDWTFFVTDSVAVDYTSADRTRDNAMAADYQQRGVAVVLPAVPADYASTTSQGTILTQATAAANSAASAATSSGAAATSSATAATQASGANSKAATLLTDLAAAKVVIDLIKTGVDGIDVVTNKLNSMLEASGLNYRFTADAISEGSGEAHLSEEDFDTIAQRTQERMDAHSPAHLRLIEVEPEDAPLDVLPNPPLASQVYGYCYAVNASGTREANVPFCAMLVDPITKQPYSYSRLIEGKSNTVGRLAMLFETGSTYLFWRKDNSANKTEVTPGDEDFVLPYTIAKTPT